MAILLDSEAKKISDSIGDSLYWHYMTLAKNGDFDSIPNRTPGCCYNRPDGSLHETWIDNSEVRSHFIERYGEGNDG
tara:strand:- start:223 stop:453 length:231 start_codon:yes stop_codon:yes gene_type:complete